MHPCYQIYDLQIFHPVKCMGFFFLVIVSEVLSSNDSDSPVVPCVLHIFVILFKKGLYNSGSTRFTSGVSPKSFIFYI